MPAARSSVAPSLAAIAEFLDETLGRERFGDDQNGVFRPSDRPVARLGLALAPWPGLGAWARARRLDALFLHRPWQLEDGQLAPEVGVLAYHLAFDECLTLGLNRRLAGALGIRGVEPFGGQPGRPIGMLGLVRPCEAGEYLDRVAAVFGGVEQALPGRDPQVERVAVVGAMTDALVRDAAARGAQLYVTGQLRDPAERAVAETELAVLAVGHARAERWGLRALAGLLRERWARLEIHSRM